MRGEDELAARQADFRQQPRNGGLFAVAVRELVPRALEAEAEDEKALLLKVAHLLLHEVGGGDFGIGGEHGAERGEFLCGQRVRDENIARDDV